MLLFLRHSLAICLIAFAAPTYAQIFELSLDEGRVAARQAALTGNFELARELALGLTQANPDDRIALIILAAVQPQMGAPRAGRAAGARAYRLSRSDGERYEAARLVALAAANEDRYTLSQIWLRRAVINAPDDSAIQQTQRDYRGIRALNPLSVNLGFSVTPSSNVNGGSETDVNIIDGLPGLVGVLSGDAQALSGLAATADLRLAYAVSRGTDQRTSLTARAYARSVWLSDEASTIAPTSRNSDFGSQVLEFGITHQRRAGDGSVSAALLTGASWFGSDLGATYNRATLGYNSALSETVAVTVSGEVQRTNLRGLFPRTNLQNTLAAGLSHVTSGGNRISGQMTYDAQASDNLNERYEILTVQASYAWADPIGPMQLSVVGGIAAARYRDYSALPGIPVPGGRRDTRVFASVTSVFNDLDYAGFVPVVSLGVQDTQSNVSRFERNEYSVNIGIRSSF